MSAVIERVSKQLYRLSSELSSMGIEEAREIEEVARDLDRVEGVLVTPAVAKMVEELASVLSRASSSSPNALEAIKDLASELRRLVKVWIPKCVRASSLLKVLVMLYSLSLVTLSVVAAMFLAPSSVPSDVATLFTIFVCSITIFGVLLGMNLMLILLPALPVAPLAQCASLAPANRALAWVCVGVAASLAASGFVAMLSVRSYRRALLALLSISSSVDSILERIKEARSAEAQLQPAPSSEQSVATSQPVATERVEEVGELPRDVYGSEAEELAKYSEEMKKLR